LTSPDPEQPDTLRELPGLGAFAGLGLTIAITLGIFVVLGIWADSALHSAPWCLVAGIVVGCIAATASTVALVRRYL
jgi:F0F1-type ATP synthase assembly protein I